METKNKIEKFINELFNNKEIHDNFIKIDTSLNYHEIYFKTIIYSGQINILNNYGLKFFIQIFNREELILYIYKN